MGFVGYDQEDGTPIYSCGCYEIKVKVTTASIINVEADPNNFDSIEDAVADWISDNVSDTCDWDFEIMDIEEVKEIE